MFLRKVAHIIKIVQSQKRVIFIPTAVCTSDAIHGSNYRLADQNIKLLIMQSYPASRYFTLFYMDAENLSVTLELFRWTDRLIFATCLWESNRRCMYQVWKCLTSSKSCRMDLQKLGHSLRLLLKEMNRESWEFSCKGENVTPRL
jgi:hypothetical protein